MLSQEESSDFKSLSRLGIICRARHVLLTRLFFDSNLLLNEAYGNVLDFSSLIFPSVVSFSSFAGHYA